MSHSSSIYQLHALPRDSLLLEDRLTLYKLSRVEKYRPVFLDDIVGNTETIERLKIIAKDGNMPHVIISGMPGIGKTTSVLCLARQLLGDAYKEAVLELNASDERGADALRLVHFCALREVERNLT
jgi:replication factor C subunit 2/4